MFAVRLELQSRFDDPYWVGRCPSDNTCACSSYEVYPSVLFAVVELVRDDVLAVSVREKVDRPCGYDANESGSETFEQRAW